MGLAPQLLPVEPSLDREYLRGRRSPPSAPPRAPHPPPRRRSAAHRPRSGRCGARARPSAAGNWSAFRRNDAHLLMSPSREPRPRRLVLEEHAIGDRRHARHIVDAAHALARAPDVAPRLELGAPPLPKFIFDLSAAGKSSGSSPVLATLRAQVVARDAAEERRIDDILRDRLDQHLLVLRRSRWPPRSR